MSEGGAAAGGPDTRDTLERAVDQLAVASWAERRELVRTLATAGDAALPTLITALVSRRDNEARIAALVDALAASAGDAESHLVALAEQPDPAVLADVAHILGRRHKPQAVPTLVRLTKHDDDNVAVAAIEALGRTGSQSAVNALVACVESNNFFRTFPAIDVLGRSGDRRAIEPLARLLESPRYAFEAARALGRSADRSAVAPLSSLLDAPSIASVRVGCLALSELCERHAARYGVATGVEESLRAACTSGRLRRVGHSLSGADRAEALAICRVFAAWRDSDATPFLLPLLDLEPELARAAGAALQQVGPPADDAQVDDPLAAALREPHSARRSVLLPSVHKRSQTEAVVACLSDREPTVRALACAALARIGSSSATPQLFALLADESARVVHAATAAIQSLGSSQTEELALAAARAEKLDTRRAALRILGYLAPASAYDVFAAALADPDARLRETAVQGLALLEHPQARPLLIELAHDADAKLRAAAMRALGQAAPDERALTCLRERLDDSDAWVRYYACQALGKQRDGESAAAIERLVLDPAGQVRVAAIEALSHIQGEVALRALRLMARADDLDVRRAALLGLGITGDQSSLPILQEAVRSSDAATRLVALAALATFQDEAVVAALAEAARDPDESVRLSALGYLGSSDLASATSSLIALALESAEPEPALAALAVSQPSRAPTLLRALESADDQLAPLLASCLSRLRSEAGTSALFAALQLPNRAARLAAAHGLAALGSRAGYTALSRAAREDDDPEVRRVCALHLAS